MHTKDMSGNNRGDDCMGIKLLKMGRKIRPLLLFGVGICIICACSKGLVENDKKALPDIRGRWTRYGRCDDSLFLGVNPFFSFWFKSDSFRYNGSAGCGAKASFEFNGPCRGDWYMQNESVILRADSVHTALVRLSSDKETLYMNGVSYARAAPCYIIEGWCDGMVLQGRIGENFHQAVDSLMQLKAEFYMLDKVSYEETMINKSILDTTWGKYTVPVYRCSFYSFSGSSRLYEWDLIDSLGNWFRLEFCPD